MPSQTRHVCLFRLQQDVSTVNRAELERFAQEIRSSLPGIVDYRFVLNRSAKGAGYALVLDSLFASLEDLRAYVHAPIHDALAKFMESFVVETVVADFEAS